MNKKGRFGEFGGQYVPETVMNAVCELENAYNHYKDDPDFCGWARMILGIGTEADALSHAPGTDGTMWEREELRRILLERTNTVLLDAGSRKKKRESK